VAVVVEVLAAVLPDYSSLSSFACESRIAIKERKLLLLVVVGKKRKDKFESLYGAPPPLFSPTTLPL